METKSFSELVTEHLMKFEKEIDGYFPSLGEDEFACLRNPSTANAQMVQAGTGVQEELVELQHDGFARDLYSEKNLCDIWLAMCNSYKKVAEPAVQALLLFPLTWPCESTFSVLLGIKSKSSHSSKLLNMIFVVLLLMFHLVSMLLLLKSRLIHHIS